MVDFDEVFAGIFISTFSVIGIGVVAYCIRECRHKPTMKKSTSSQELNSIDDSDPQMIV